MCAAMTPSDDRGEGGGGGLASGFVVGSRVLARIFITGCPKWGFKKIWCPNPYTEKK